MLVQIGDRIASITWELLLTTLYLSNREKIENGRVTLISPWISDVHYESYALPLPIRDEVSSEIGRNLNSLSSVLIALAKSDVEVTLITHSLRGAWKREWNQKSKDRERTFLSKLKREGIQILTHDHNHAKLISTPLGTLSGSANITENGFYKNQESMELTLANASSFSQSVGVIEDILAQAIIYS